MLRPEEERDSSKGYRIKFGAFVGQQKANYDGVAH